MTVEQVLEIVGESDLPMAINIKSDCLTSSLSEVMATKPDLNWFAFDMSIPDSLVYLKAGIPVFVRMSEFEVESSLLGSAAGVWLDAFFDEWYDMELINSLLSRGKAVCIVSPELHGRSYESLWQRLKPFSRSSGVMLCTDHPKLARTFFGEPA